LKAALYARVSTTDKNQNPEVQLEVLREYCRQMGWDVYQEYVDYASAADLVGRKQWVALMKAASTRRFDILLVWKIDRAFRSVIQAVGSLKSLRAYHVGFRSYTESAIDTTTPYGEFMFNVLAAFAELEREQIRQRVNAGMQHAKAHGTKSGLPIGRKPLNIGLKNVSEALQSHYKALRGEHSGRIKHLTVRRTAAELKVSPGYVYQVVKQNGLSVDAILSEVRESP